MQSKLLSCSMLLCTAITIAMASAARAETTSAGNTYLAGGELKITQPVPGDLVAAGGRVSVTGSVGADAALSGGTVDVRAPIGEDLRVAGGSVNIEDKVGADLVAAGGSVHVAPDANIEQSAWIAGGDVTVDGRIGHGARIYGNTITLTGDIRGDTRLYGDRITFAKSAHIDGNLFYASPTALPDEQLRQVNGTITRMESPAEWHAGGQTNPARSWFHPLFLLSMLACGALLNWLFPNAIAGVQKAMRENPGRSLLIGTALLFSVPPVAILFMATVIGLPIGFALLLLYPLALLLGYLATAFFLGQGIARVARQPEQLSRTKQVLYLALALLLLTLALAVPFLGGFILLLAVVSGLGGWSVWWSTRSRRAP